MMLPILSLSDRDNRLIGELPYTDLDVVSTWNAVGTGSVIVPELHPLFGSIAALTDEVVLARVDHRRPWTGRVTELDLQLDRSRGSWQMELTLVDDWIWLKALLARQNPLGNLNQQGYAEFDTRTGPAETVIKAILADIVVRTGVPIVIAPAPDPDPSPIITTKARMDSVAELIDDALAASNLGLTVTTLGVGDAPPASLADAGVAPGTVIVDAVPMRVQPWLLWDEAELVKGSLTFTSPSAHTATVGGAGDGVAKTYTMLSDDALAASLGRYGLPEIYVDAGTNDPAVKGAAKLAEVRGGVTANFTVEDGMPWSAYQDYELGDLGGGQVADVDWRAPITQIRLAANDSGEVAYTPKLGTPTPPPEAVVVQAVRKLAASVAAERRRR